MVACNLNPGVAVVVALVGLVVVMDGGVRGGTTLDLEENFNASKPQASTTELYSFNGPLPGYTLIAIAHRPPLTGTGDTIGGTHTMTPVALSLGHTPPATDDAGLWPSILRYSPQLSQVLVITSTSQHKPMATVSNPLPCTSPPSLPPLLARKNHHNAMPTWHVIPTAMTVTWRVMFGGGDVEGDDGCDAAAGTMAARATMAVTWQWQCGRW
ncbi:hypothetical protein EDB83DRAFT_2326403 [Lactarius deliciosus]|nr:hypothetical protein EDB83DRAFT_2326403 [Lactarius deliciosus]